jgi:hypothetical protein
MNPNAFPRDQSDTGQESSREPNMISRIARASLLAIAVTTATASIAFASTPYDGRWSLSIVTQRGACDTYNFPVDIANGQVSFPGLVRASGRVGKGGAVRVNVAAGDKSASGAGKLTGGSGHGRWSGRSGSATCSGTWTAQRS